jgi:hypothetical protein
LEPVAAVRTHRRFTWHVAEPDQDRLLVLADQVRDTLAAAVADTPQFFSDPWVGGAAVGVLQFRVTIHDRDQWWVGRRARLLVEQLRQRTDVQLDMVTEEQVKLPPHMVRGKWRLRRLARARAGNG